MQEQIVENAKDGIEDLNALDDSMIKDMDLPKVLAAL